MVQFAPNLKNTKEFNMNTKKQIYTKDKTVKITFRCDDALGTWLASRSKVVGLTPSAFVRQLCYQNFYAEKTFGDIIKKPLKTSTETAVEYGTNN